MHETEDAFNRRIVDSGNFDLRELAYMATSSRMRAPGNVVNGEEFTARCSDDVGGSMRSLLQALCR